MCATLTLIFLNSYKLDFVNIKGVLWVLQTAKAVIQLVEVSVVVVGSTAPSDLQIWTYWKKVGIGTQAVMLYTLMLLNGTDWKLDFLFNG